MNRYICIHGHFYQPPRENPWLNEVELQESASPYHDWNERINDECYARNSASRILDGQGKIVDIINNYARISFNFGPTLLEWMKKKEPETYKSILEADKESQNRFSGHGSALAQVYNHIIMPLANERDKQTQVIWAIYDFRNRFGRDPEGMWLAETAADTPTLEVLAEHGIKFTILSPYQARSVRKIGEREWHNAEGANINPRLPYLCKLPSGKQIVLFFYDGPVSQGIAFERLLTRGEDFAHRLVGALDDRSREPQLMHIATDGETYGHHHRFGEMALSYALNHIEERGLARVTIYGEYLEMFPPEYEAQIIEETSWSCAHGVERWRSNCGCNTGGNGGWDQEWRSPLRKAFDWLRDELSPLYIREMEKLGAKPWETRNAYIQVIMDRSEKNVEAFIKRHTSPDLTKKEKVRFLKLLEMQYHTLLMYTSCGWFFDEVTGIETVQDIYYAARAIQLAQDLGDENYEEEFVRLLERARSNHREKENAARAYIKSVKPTIIDLLRVGAHYAVSSLFAEHAKKLELYCYEAISEEYELKEAGRQKLAVGRARIRSLITWEEEVITFGVLHLGDHQLFGGVREFMSQEDYNQLSMELHTAFDRGNVSEVIMLMDKHFESHNYSFWHLFKDDQKKILDQVLEHAMDNVENNLQQLYDNNYPLMAAIKTLGMKLPRPLQTTVEYIINTKLLREFESEKPDVREVKRLLDEAKRMKAKLNFDTLDFAATQRVDQLMKKVQENSDDMDSVELLIDLLKVIEKSKLQVDYWQAQNIAFRMQQIMLQNYKMHYAGADQEDEVGHDRLKVLYENLNLKT
jgi:alpha-amylase/alpha-mannosidase (GH57 family)